MPLSTTLKTSRAILVTTFERFSREIGFRIAHPFVLRAEDGELEQFPLILPDHGGPNGAVIDVLEASDHPRKKARVNALRASGLYYSFVNAEYCRNIDRDGMMEMLDDWAYYGNPNF